MKDFSLRGTLGRLSADGEPAVCVTSFCYCSSLSGVSEMVSWELLLCCCVDNNVVVVVVIVLLLFILLLLLLFVLYF